MNQENVERLRSGISSFGLSLDDKQIQTFSRYSQALQEWNKKMNLTAITEEREIVIKHFIDSISVVPFLPEDVSSIIDVGTGAGFPGIPLKIMMKELKVTLLDSLEKRVGFLNHIISENSLLEIKAIHKRAEDLAREKEYREAYDIGISRAVAALPVLCEYVMPFVKVGGFFIAMKGSDVQKELTEAERAIYILGGEVQSVKQFHLFENYLERHIILIKKIRQIPGRFPRKSGKPSKSPLK